MSIRFAYWQKQAIEDITEKAYTHRTIEQLRIEMKKIDGVKYFL
ncbi:MAG: hypothetical protein ACLU97_13320 [Dorea sp.]